MITVEHLENGYTLRAIELNEDSPMVNHRGGDIAVDEERKIMYCWEVSLNLYGLESIRKACLTYRRKENRT